MIFLTYFDINRDVSNLIESIIKHKISLELGNASDFYDSKKFKGEVPLYGHNIVHYNWVMQLVPLYGDSEVLIVIWVAVSKCVLFLTSMKPISKKVFFLNS